MNGPKPQITVAMPAYNAAAHIREAVDSILAQSFEDFEVFLSSVPHNVGEDLLIYLYFLQIQ